MYHNLVKAHICHLLLIWMNENRNRLIYSHVFLYSYILVKQRWRQHSLLRSPAIWYLSPGTLRTSPAFCGACFYILKYCWCIQLIGATNATEYQIILQQVCRWLANEERNVTCFKQACANDLFQARFCALKISTINETKLASGLAPIKYLGDLCDNLEMLFIVQSLHRKHQY